MAKKVEKVRKSLIRQLEAKNACFDHFIGLVNDYCFYFETVEQLKKDILEKGVTYTSMSASGKEYEKDNPALKLLPGYTRQMLQILKDLGLNTANVMVEEDDEL